MENDFLSLLVDDATVAGLVGSRIYPATYAQSSGDPCIRFRKITGSTGLHMQGPDGLSESLMQVDVRAVAGPPGEGSKKAMAIRDAIVALLHGYRGVKGSTLFDQVSLRDDRGIEFEKTDTGSYYTASLDFDVWSRVAA